jgi:hypothetical protein
LISDRKVLGYINRPGVLLPRISTQCDRLYQKKKKLEELPWLLFQKFPFPKQMAVRLRNKHRVARQHGYQNAEKPWICVCSGTAERKTSNAITVDPCSLEALLWPTDKHTSVQQHVRTATSSTKHCRIYIACLSLDHSCSSSRTKFVEPENERRWSDECGSLKASQTHLGLQIERLCIACGRRFGSQKSQSVQIWQAK